MDDLDAALADFKANPTDPVLPRLRNSLFYGVQAQPDAEAKLREYSRRLNVPVISAFSDPKDTTNRGKVEELNPEGLIQMSPRTANWLATPDNAAVAHDDVGILAQMESGLANIGKGMAEGMKRVNAGFARGALTLVDQPADAVSELSAALGIPTVVEWDDTGIRLRKFTAADKADLGVGGQRKALKTYEDLKFGYAPGTTWEEVKATPLDAAIPFILEQGLVSAPDMAAAILSAPMYALSLAGTMSQNRAENDKRADATLGDLVAVLPAAAASALMERLGAKGIIGIDEAIAKGAGGVAKETGKAAVTEGVTEMGQEALQITAENAGTAKGMPDAGKVVDQMLAAGVAGAGYGGALRSVTATVQAVSNRDARDQGRADQAAAINATFGDLMTAAKASALRARAPETFESFVQAASEGSPVENVYINAQDLVDVLAQGDLAALQQNVEVIQAMPSVMAQLQDALVGNSLIEVPVSELLTYTPDTELAQTFMDNLKVDPTGMSAKEAEVFMQTRAADLEADMAKAVAEGLNQDEFQASSERVRQGMLDQLNKANRYTSDANDSIARMHAQVMATFALSEGVSPEEFSAMHPLTIRAQGVTDGAFMATDTRSPEFRNWFGDSKVMDRSGAPLTVYHGTPDGRFLKEDGAFKGAPERMGFTDEATDGDHWFTSSRATAKTYANDDRAFDYQNAEPGVVSAYLRMANPMEIDGQGKEWQEAQTLSEAEYTALGADADSTVITIARARGHDGVIIRNVKDDYNNDTANKPTDVYVVFKSEQIKSVDNSGSFDPNSRNIFTQEKAAQEVISTRLANAYREEFGIEGESLLFEATPDVEVMKRIADAFEAAKDTPNDPATIAAYRALAEETIRQFHYMGDITVEPWNPELGDTAYPSSMAMVDDVFTNNHLWYYPTTEGTFGEGELNTANPMLQDTGVTDTTGRPLLVNDVFRIVHDFFGHTQNSLSFGAKGELNAYLEHAQMYSAAAQPALAAETLMQNAWVNFGPHLRRADGSLPTQGDPDYVPIKDRRFADQKFFVAPTHVLREADILRDRGADRFAAAQRAKALLQEYRSFRRGQGDVGTAARIEPIPGPDGKVKLTHWSLSRGLRSLNPDKWGRNRDVLTRDEAQTIGEAPNRTYYGLSVGDGSWGYEREPALGTHRYEASVDPSRLYDYVADPERLRARAAELAAADEAEPERLYYEQAIKEAGHAGYWLHSPSLGLVAAVYEKLPAKYIGEDVDQEFYQSHYSYSPGLGFRSTLMEAVTEKGQAKANPEQWISTLKNTPGVKKEELEWVGLEDWLNTLRLQQQTVVTKQEVLAFIAENGVRLDEKELGAEDWQEEMYEDPAFQDRESEIAEEAFKDSYTAPEWKVLPGYFNPDDSDYIVDAEPVELDADGNPVPPPVDPEADLPPGPDNIDLSETKYGGVAGFSRMQLAPKARAGFFIVDEDDHQYGTEFAPGDSYRMLEGPFATLEEAVARNKEMLEEHEQEAREASWEDGSASDWAGQQAYDEFSEQYAPKWESYTLDGGDNYRELLLRFPHNKNNSKITNAFTGAHWSVADDIMAHARMKDRTDMDGNLVLFIEEVQSDWHQQGRDRGYDDGQVATQEERDAAADAELTTQRVRDAAEADVIALGKELAGRTDLTLISDLHAQVTAARDAYAKRHGDSSQFNRDPTTRMSDGARAVVTLTERAGPGTANYSMVQHSNVLLRMFANFHEPQVEANPTWTDEQAEYRGLAKRAYDTGKAYDDAVLRAQEAALNLNAVVRKGRGGIPDAPYKNSWPTLVMRRLIAYAVGSGYSRMAFTRGDLIGPIVGAGDKTGWFYEKNLINVTNDIIKKAGLKVYDDRVRTGEGEAVRQRIMGAAERIPLLKADIIERTARLRADMATAGVSEDYLSLNEDAQMPEGEKLAAAIRYQADEIMNAQDKERGREMTLEEVVSLPQDPRLTELEDLLDRAHRLGIQANELKRQEGILDDDAPKVHFFDINEQLEDLARAGLPLFQGESAGEARGAFNPSTNTITLLRTANLSTALHELGHFYLETMARVASDPSASMRVKSDWAKAAKFMGFAGVAPEAWLRVPVNERREGHEKWARAFEAYLREGKAPSTALKKPFQKFRSWLVHLYKSVLDLNVQLTPEVRGVFDRLVASDEEIAQAEAERSMAPIMATKPEGMDELAWRSYQDLGAEAQADAQDALTARSVRDMQWLATTRARIIRELSAEARERRKAAEAEVTDEVLAEPVYAAQYLFKRGLHNGEKWDGPNKLDIAEVEALYADVPGELQDWRKLGFGKYGMLGKEGMTPDQAAELFGFSSGHEMVEAILNADPMADVIQARTDQLMMERHGDLKDADAIAKAADEAIHNETRLKFVAAEAAALAKAAGKPSVLIEAARTFARSLIGRQRIRDVKPGKYAAAAAQAAQTSARAAGKGDLKTAAASKRNQLLNAHIAKAAYDAQAEVDKAMRYLARFSSVATRKGMDPDYRDQIDALLERFDLRKGQSLKAIDKRKNLADWIAAQEALGLNPTIDPTMRNEAYRKHYKDLTVDEMRGLIEAVKNIAHLGRLKHRLLKAADGRALQAVLDEAEAEIVNNAYQTLPDKLEHNTWQDRWLSGFANFGAIHRKFASIFREMAGLNNEGGILWKAFVKPMNDANDKEAVMREQATVALGKLYASLQTKKGALRRKIFVPEIGTSISLEGRLAVALNWGNETNRARVMDGHGWTEDQVNAILKTLTPNQAQFVNDMWDYLDSFWPEIAAKERRVTGTAPEKVDAEPFEMIIAGGVAVQMRGGYYPIKYDTEKSSAAESNELAEDIRSALLGATTRATTKRGHTQARVEKVERKIRLDITVPFGHVNQVIHDLAFHETLIDLNRLLASKQIDSAIRAHYGVETLRTIKKTVADMATGDVPAQDALERAVNHIRVGSTITGLGWNLMSGLLQPLGLAQSLVRIGPKYMAKGIGMALTDVATLQNTVKAIGLKSDFMRLRAKTFLREVNEIQNRVQDNIAPDGWTHVESTFFILIQKLQLVADVPTWMGQYHKSLDQGKDEATAIALADQAVRDSQGGGQIGDLSQIQRGSVWLRLWTNFYSFFNVTYNQLAETVAETRRVGPGRLPLLAADVLILMVVPGIAAELMRGALRGDEWEPEEIGPELVKAQVSYLLGTMVGLRELGMVADLGLALAGQPTITKNNGKGPASLRLLTSDLPALIQQSAQGEMDAAWRKAAINTAGILFHFPAGQINRTWDGIEALAKGDTDRPLAVLVGPPRDN